MEHYPATAYGVADGRWHYGVGFGCGKDGAYDFEAVFDGCVLRPAGDGPDVGVGCVEV